MKKETAEWQRMQFKKNKVWLMVDDQGNPIVKDHKVLIKYNLNQDYEYWVHAKSVTAIDPQQLKQKASGYKRRQSHPKKNGQVAQMADNIGQESAIVIFTDGASSGNPGPSGIGVVLRHGNHKKEIFQAIGETTNNIAELEAIRAGLAALKQTHLPIRLYTDSAYALGVLTLGWKVKKNIALIQVIKDLMAQFDDIQLIKVSGHSGVPDNERADLLATMAIKTDATYPGTGNS